MNFLKILGKLCCCFVLRLSQKSVKISLLKNKNSMHFDLTFKFVTHTRNKNIRAYFYLCTVRNTFWKAAFMAIWLIVRVVNIFFFNFMLYSIYTCSCIFFLISENKQVEVESTETPVPEVDFFLVPWLIYENVFCRI